MSPVPNMLPRRLVNYWESPQFRSNGKPARPTTEREMDVVRRGVCCHAYLWAGRTVCVTKHVGIAKQAWKSATFSPRRFSFPRKLGTFYGIRPRRALFTSTYGLRPALRACRPSWNVSRRIFGNSPTLGDCSLLPGLVRHFSSNLGNILGSRRNISR
jgi:hypothetical protein